MFFGVAETDHESIRVRAIMIVLTIGLSGQISTDNQGQQILIRTETVPWKLKQVIIQMDACSLLIHALRTSP